MLLYTKLQTVIAQTAEFKADGSSNTDSSIKVLSGETSKVELDIVAKPIEGLNIIAGYSYNDAFTKTSGFKRELY
jgi:iron complex outermembrane receptor protein